MSHSNPLMVTFASQFSGKKHRMPHRGGRLSTGELESISDGLRTLLKVTARLADTVDQIRLRALSEQKLIVAPEPLAHSDSDSTT